MSTVSGLSSSSACNARSDSVLVDVKELRNAKPVMLGAAVRLDTLTDIGYDSEELDFNVPLEVYGGGRWRWYSFRNATEILRTIVVWGLFLASLLCLVCSVVALCELFLLYGSMLSVGFILTLGLGFHLVPKIPYQMVVRHYRMTGIDEPAKLVADVVIDMKALDEIKKKNHVPRRGRATDEQIEEYKMANAKNQDLRTISEQRYPCDSTRDKQDRHWFVRQDTQVWSVMPSGNDQGWDFERDTISTEDLKVSWCLVQELTKMSDAELTMQFRSHVLNKALKTSNVNTSVAVRADCVSMACDMMVLMKRKALSRPPQITKFGPKLLGLMLPDFHDQGALTSYVNTVMAIIAGQ